jgi:hypothetical protein
MSDQKPWFISKTIITSGVAFALAIATASGLLDAETGAKIQGLLIPLILTFLRLGDQELV